MSLTNEQKKTVAKFMGWRVKTSVAHVLGTHTDFEFMTVDDGFNNIHFSLNDAALCVDEMRKRGKWLDFRFVSFGLCGLCDATMFESWLMTMESGEAENFFTAMAAWIEEKK
jgi:hypothetical protein